MEKKEASIEKTTLIKIGKNTIEKKESSTELKEITKALFPKKPGRPRKVNMKEKEEYMVIIDPKTISTYLWYIYCHGMAAVTKKILDIFTEEDCERLCGIGKKRDNIAASVLETAWETNYFQKNEFEKMEEYKESFWDFLGDLKKYR
jgi:hypothetical protein